MIDRLASIPVAPDRNLARAWAQRELARQEYQDARPGPLQRALDWIGDRLQNLNLGAGPGPGLGLLVVALLVFAVAGYLIYRAGGLHRTVRRRTAAVLPDVHTSAADHRAQADRYAADRQWDLAVVERFRAIARDLEERTLLSPQPGRTAVEVARDSGAAVPELAGELLQAAHYFDQVSYGHLPVGEPADLALRRLDTRLRAAGAVALR